MNIIPIFPDVVDNSMRKELVKCEKAAHYKYECGLQPVDAAQVDKLAGKAFAAGMEAMRWAYYVDGLSENDSLNMGIAALYAAYGSFEAPPKSNKTAARMAGALAFYVEQNPFAEEPLKPVDFGGGKLGIEVAFSFDTGIGHPVTGANLPYCGRFDMLGQDENGDCWVVDEKTTSQMGDKWANQWLLDSQMTGYCWGAQKLLDEHGIVAEVKGAVINGIAIRLRDYEHLRLNTYRQPWEIERWYHQMVLDMERWRNAYLDQHHNQILDHACANYNNPCEYAKLCKARNPERLIEGNYVIKRWNPLTREET